MVHEASRKEEGGEEHVELWELNHNVKGLTLNVHIMPLGDILVHM